MKICRVSFDYPNDEAPGAGLTMYYLSKYIDAPTLFLTKKMNRKIEETPNHVKLNEISFKDKRTPNSLRNELHTHRRKNFIKKILTHLKIIITMRGVKFFLKSIPSLISFKPDIVACHDNRSIFHGVFAKYVLGSKFFFHLHNNAEINVLRNLWLLKSFVKRADLIFCLSHNMGMALTDVCPTMAGKIRYTSTGVNPSLFKNMGLDRKDQIIAIGRLKWSKGYKHLLDAVHKVFDLRPEYKLIIIGRGPEEENMEKQIESLGLSEKIQLIGTVSRKRIVELLNESRIFVMSSLAEGLPKVLLEALACGTPAVITSGCNAENIIQGKGLLVETKNPESLAKAINRLIEDEEFWKKCSKNSREIIEKYNWKNVAQRVFVQYKELMK